MSFPNHNEPDWHGERAETAVRTSEAFTVVESPLVARSRLWNESCGFVIMCISGIVAGLSMLRLFVEFILGNLFFGETNPLEWPGIFDIATVSASIVIALIGWHQVLQNRIAILLSGFLALLGLFACLVFLLPSFTRAVRHDPSIWPVLAVVLVAIASLCLPMYLGVMAGIGMFNGVRLGRSAAVRNRDAVGE
jgi:hypothetical protein